MYQIACPDRSLQSQFVDPDAANIVDVAVDLVVELAPKREDVDAAGDDLAEH